MIYFFERQGWTNIYSTPTTSGLDCRDWNWVDFGHGRGIIEKLSWVYPKSSSRHEQPWLSLETTVTIPPDLPAMSRTLEHQPLRSRARPSDPPGAVAFDFSRGDLSSRCQATQVRMPKASKRPRSWQSPMRLEYLEWLVLVGQFPDYPGEECVYHTMQQSHNILEWSINND